MHVIFRTYIPRLSTITPGHYHGYLSKYLFLSIIEDHDQDHFHSSSDSGLWMKSFSHEHKSSPGQGYVMRSISLQGSSISSLRESIGKSSKEFFLRKVGPDAARSASLTSMRAIDRTVFLCPKLDTLTWEQINDRAVFSLCTGTGRTGYPASRGVWCCIGGATNIKLATEYPSPKKLRRANSPRYFFNLSRFDERGSILVLRWRAKGIVPSTFQCWHIRAMEIILVEGDAPRLLSVINMLFGRVCRGRFSSKFIF